MWPRAGRAGFTVIEVLVALAVAGLVLGVLARAFGLAWSVSARPLETVSALEIAATAADDERSSGRIGGFSVVGQTAAIEFIARKSLIAPAPPGDGPSSGSAPPATSSTPIGQNAAILRGLTPLAGSSGSAQAPASPILAGLTPLGSSPGAGRAGGPPLRLRRVSVEVTMPSRRRFDWTSVRPDAAEN